MAMYSLWLVWEHGLNLRDLQDNESWKCKALPESIYLTISSVTRFGVKPRLGVDGAGLAAEPARE